MDVSNRTDLPGAGVTTHMKGHGGEKKRSAGGFFVLAVLIFFISFVSGCGLPGDIKKRAADIEKKLAEQEKETGGREQAYAKLAGTEDFKTEYGVYAEREKWADSFDKARRKIAEARDVSARNLAPLIKRNKRKDIGAVDALLNKINDIVMEASRLSMAPMNRMEVIRSARENTGTMRGEAMARMAGVKALMGGLSPVIEKSLSTHPDRTDAIHEKTKDFKGEYKTAVESMATIERESRSASPDYAYFADACASLEKNAALMEKQTPLLASKLGELDKSYSKTLIDMNAEYYVQIGRVSWLESESVEYPSETEFTYPPVQVVADTFEYFSEWPDEKNVAQVRSFFGRSFSLEVEQKMWDRLNLDPMMSWPYSDNEADYYIKDTPGKYFHKYRILENEKTTETGWVEVSEDVFFANEDNLGMDLMVKPYGSFEEEAVKTATPQGMAYVNNPRYGRWVTGRDGLSFWEFYGMYSLLNNLVGMRYTRPDYDTWYRDYRYRKPYYGREKEEERYGSGGVFTRTRYSGSYYSRSGGFRRMEETVRGAGARSRGGGFGGGGK